MQNRTSQMKYRITPRDLSRLKTVFTEELNYYEDLKMQQAEVRASKSSAEKKLLELSSSNSEEIKVLQAYINKLSQQDKEIDQKKLKHEIEKNIALSVVGSQSFFEKGQGGITQVKRDYQTGLQVAGQKKLGIDEKIIINVNDEEIDKLVKRKLAELLGEECVEAFIASHSQGPLGSIPMVMGCAVNLPIDPEKMIVIAQPDDRTSNVYLDPKDKNVYQEIFMEDLPIKSNGGRKVSTIGTMPGPFKATYKMFKNAQDEWGYELNAIETDNGYFVKAIQGTKFSAEQIEKVFCDPEFINAYNTLKNTINDPNLDPSLRDLISKQLHEIKIIQSDPEKNINLATLTRVVQNSNEIIHNTKIKTDEKINQLKNQLAELKTYQTNRDELISLTKDEQYDESSRTQGIKTLNALDNYSRKLKYPTKIAPSFVVASNSIKQPLANVGACLEEAKKFSKLPGGQIVAGAFLSFAGVALTVAFGLLTAASFGLSSPITLPAMVASAGLAIAGASIAAGTLTFAAAVTTIFGLFKPALPKEEKQLGVELEKLAETSVKIKNG